MKSLKRYMCPVIYSLDQPYVGHGDGTYRYPHKMSVHLASIAFKDWHDKHFYLIKVIGKYYETTK